MENAIILYGTLGALLYVAVGRLVHEALMFEAVVKRSEKYPKELLQSLLDRVKADDSEVILWSSVLWPITVATYAALLLFVALWKMVFGRL